MAAALAIGLCSCASWEVATDWDESVDFAALATWRLADVAAAGEADGARALDPVVRARLAQAIERELASWGYRRIEDGEPDFVVSVSHEVQDVADYERRARPTFGEPWGFRYASGGWGYGPLEVGEETVVDVYRQRTLVIDLARPGGGSIWRGSGSARVDDPDAGLEPDAVDAAVVEIMEAFPPPPLAAP